MDITELFELLDSISNVTNDEFISACATAKKLNLPQENTLQLYGLYKQSTIGDVNIPCPPDLIDKMKWEAWQSFRGFPNQSAANVYVYLVNESADTSSKTTNSTFGQSVSTLQGLTDEIGDDFKEDEALLAAAATGDDDKLLSILVSGGSVDVNRQDDEGMTALHYASDRGHLYLVKTLLQYGANINIRCNEGNTPLMYAIICEHEELVRYLLGEGAGLWVLNKDGQDAFSLPDLSESISLILHEMKDRKDCT